MKTGLLEGFLHHHPERVAATLNSLSVSELSQFLDSVDSKVIGSVLTRMDKFQLSRYLDNVSIENLADIIIDSNLEDALMLVSRLPGHHYEKILESVKAKNKPLSERLVAFSDRALSAFLEVDYLSVQEETTIQTLKEELEIGQGSKEQPVYLVDKNHGFLGGISLVGVLCSKAIDRKLKEFKVDIPTLSKSMPIESAIESELWLDWPCLPVVNNRNRLLGVVRLRSLKAHFKSENIKHYGISDIASDITFSYLRTLADLLDILVLGQKNEHR